MLFVNRKSLDILFQMGNQEGFNDIDNQRKSEVNYKFSFEDEFKKQQVRFYGSKS